MGENQGYPGSEQEVGLWAKAELEKKRQSFVILWESCDHVHATEQETMDIERQPTQTSGMEEPDEGGAQTMKMDGEDLASAR